MEVLRTPDERFASLPGFDFEPHYLEIGGVRLARIEAGEGEPVVFLHGEPTWSYLWRNVIPPVAEAGFRCIAPDLAGFGRSDKPADLGWYSYDRHVDLIKELLGELGVSDATLVAHDWGGPIGLRLAAENPGLFARIVVMDTGLFTGRQQMSDAWHRFRDFVERTPDVPISMLVRNACATDPGDEVAAAYDAPFPAPEYKAGARAFPLILPLRPEDPGRRGGRGRVQPPAREPAAGAGALGRRGPGPPVRGRGEGRRRPGPAAADARSRAHPTSSRRTRARRSAATSRPTCSPRPRPGSGRARRSRRARRCRGRRAGGPGAATRRPRAR